MEFTFYTAPRIVFGPRVLDQLGTIAASIGQRVLVVTGNTLATQNGLLPRLARDMPGTTVVQITGEPTIEEVDRTVDAAKNAACDVVVAVGGGSVLDCGKAAAAMVTNPGSLHDYLEGLGRGRIINTPPLPTIAVPTTAGTGSEVTKNAVISGPGFKKSIRHPWLIPRVALVDPCLTHSMPPSLTATCGLDALTQLIESYMSRQATPFTDALALRGIRAAGQGLERSYRNPEDTEGRELMALASLLGGVCLANAGLGAVHGFASPLGAYFPIPHGVACAALLPQVMRGNLTASQHTEQGAAVWRRFAEVAEALTQHQFVDRTDAVDAGIVFLQQLQRRLKVPRLGSFGVTADDVTRIVAGARGSSMRFNPIELTDEQLASMLRAAL